MIRSVLSLVVLFFASANASAYVDTKPILSGTEYIYAGQTGSIRLHLGGPVRILSLKVTASSTTRRAVNTDISVAGHSVGTIMLPGHNPDPTFSAGGSGTDTTASIEFTSNGGTVAISQIYVTYEVPETIPAPVAKVEVALPWDTFPVRTEFLRPLDRSNVYAYYGDLTIAVVDAMAGYVSPIEWQTNLFPIKWKASELKNLAKAYGSSNRDVIASLDKVVQAIDAKADFLMEKSLTPVTWPFVTDLESIREKLAALSGYQGRAPTPSALNSSQP